MEGVLIILIIFGFIYGAITQAQRSKERMAMIRQGMNPQETDQTKGNQFENWMKNYSLKLGLVALAIGLGTFVANLFILFGDGNMRHYSDELYFSFIAFFGGAALVVNYFLEQDAERKQGLIQKRKAVDYSDNE